MRRGVLYIAVFCWLMGTSGLGAELAPLRAPEAARSDLEIVSPCIPNRPFTVAGPYGAILGRQSGVFEAWSWPVKILSHFSIRAEIADYPVPIDVNALAAQITVRPGETIITYSHAAFTIRQHMFASREAGEKAAGAIVFFEFESVRPLKITFSFTPEMLRMWPAPNFGRPSGEWVAQGSSGVYVLRTDNPHFSALVGMPGSRPGIMVPYQEHPQTFPLELKLSFDPKRDSGLVYPLLMSVVDAQEPSALASKLNAAVASSYAATGSYYAHFFDSRLTMESPDAVLNSALRWAEIAIDQMQVDYHGETGLVAGYYESADSARPGYAWFFGRDTLWTTYAINSYGDFALTRRALAFLLRRQRADGKIMHEFSQSADAIDWQATPYYYASADATPLLVMAMADYLRNSGDTAFLKENWDAVKKAYSFTRAHAGNDGIYSNAQGTGWVESWPPGMPEEEIYLAALDEQSSEAFSVLARTMGDAHAAMAAGQEAALIKQRIEAEYYQAPSDFYAFSRNSNGSLDTTRSIYPAVAWWDGTLRLAHGEKMLDSWASHEFSTDWGTRDISEQTAFYDPISYHQGSVWPLFTGWTSLAEYRTGRPLSGYSHLMQNSGLTRAQDLGSLTELLSGQFYQPLGRSSSHQMWSSAMIVAPLLRGLFGVSADAPHHVLRVRPQLPADWENAALHNVPLGMSKIDLQFKREGEQLAVYGSSKGGDAFCLLSTEDSSSTCVPSSKSQKLLLALPPVELSVPAELPSPGAETRQLKVVGERTSAHRAVFTFEGWAGSQYRLPVRLNLKGVKVENGTIAGGKLLLQFPSGRSYVSQTVSFAW